MKRVEKWKWRIQWAGRPTTTRVHFFEDEIRPSHPDATRVEGSCIFVELPETQAEIDAHQPPAWRGGEDARR